VGVESWEKGEGREAGTSYVSHRTGVERPGAKVEHVPKPTVSHRMGVERVACHRHIFRRNGPVSHRVGVEKRLDGGWEAPVQVSHRTGVESAGYRQEAIRLTEFPLEWVLKKER
jgi:hypothetical protein